MSTVLSHEVTTPVQERPVMTITGLNHWFGKGETKQQGLKDVNLHINLGEIVLLKGPSGCGKTTLLTLLGGLRTVEYGSVVVLGQEMRGLGAAQLVLMRRRIGFIFQLHNLFSSLTALQNVMLALELQEPDLRKRRERATAMLDRLKMSERLNYRPAGLSGGQRQRVAIARALAGWPKLVLADEPTAALDAGATDLVAQLFKEMARGGDNPDERSTLLVATHDEKIMGMADRYIFMRNGKIISNVVKGDADHIVEALKKNELFSKLTPQTLRRIAERMGMEKYDPGTYLFRQGDVGERFYLIWQGKVEISIETPGSPTYTVVLTPPQVFGEKAMLAPDGRRRGAARALDEVQLFSMDKLAFEATIAESPELNLDLRNLYPEIHNAKGLGE